MAAWAGMVPSFVRISLRSTRAQADRQLPIHPRLRRRRRPGRVLAPCACTTALRCRLPLGRDRRNGGGTASPAAPRPGPCTRPRTGRCRGRPATSHGPVGRLKGASRSCGPACGRPRPDRRRRGPVTPAASGGPSRAARPRLRRFLRNQSAQHVGTARAGQSRKQCGSSTQGPRLASHPTSRSQVL
jgi:hypothetical protein